MKKVLFIVFFHILFMTNVLFATEESASFGRFGSLTLYYNSPSPKNVVIFISGDGGWNLGVVDMARELSSLDALVIGVDITHYIKESEKSDDKCFYPAGDFEELSKFVQQKLNFPEYITPVLVGYSSGATLVYATLVQAPPNTFLGALSLGFCPDLLLTKPLCKGSGLEWKTGPKEKGYIFLPSKTLEVPWIAFQGAIDQVCDPKATEEYVNQVKNGKLVMLQKVGHGYSVPKNWMPQFKETFSTLVNRHDAAFRGINNEKQKLEDLPLVEVPSSAPGGDTMAVFVSGDGGWGVTDSGLSKVLARNGIPVVGLNSLHYFWTRRTPETSAKDLERILTYYLTAWNKKWAIVIGYSMGADVLPFMLNRLPDDLLAKVRSVVLLGPGHEVEFEFHFTNWVGGSQGEQALPVIPEVEKLRVKDIVCFYGSNDKDAICNSLPPGLTRNKELKGGHRIGSNYEGIAKIILGKAE